MNDLKLKIKYNNPWYTSNQIEMAQKKPYARTIKNRLKFITEEVRDYCNLAGGKVTILDAGCGDGIYLRELHFTKNAIIYGIDYNFLRAHRAKNINNDSFLMNGSLEYIPIKNNTFDIILLSQVLEHIKDDDVVLREIYRILKIRGIMILGVPNEGCLLAQMRNRIFQRSILKETDHINFYTEANIRTKLKLNGFRAIKINRESFFLPCTYIHDVFAGSNYGYRLLKSLGHIFKSQCAGLYFVCEKL